MIFKLVAFFVMFATVIAVAAAVSTLVTGIVNVGIMGVKKTHMMDRAHLRKAMGKMHPMMGHSMHTAKCRTEVPFEDVEGEHKI